MTIEIIEYEWAGSWGPFRIRSECKECGLTKAIIEDMIAKEFPGKMVRFVRKPWLNSWFPVLLKGGYHPPIVMVNGKKFHQFSEKDPLVNRKALAQHIRGLLGE